MKLHPLKTLTSAARAFVSCALRETNRLDSSGHGTKRALITLLRRTQLRKNINHKVSSQNILMISLTEHSAAKHHPFDYEYHPLSTSTLG